MPRFQLFRSIGASALVLVLCAPFAGAGTMDFARIERIDREVDRLEAYLAVTEQPDYREVEALGRKLIDLVEGHQGAGAYDGGGATAKPEWVPRIGESTPGGGQGEVSTVPIELVLSQVSLQTGSNHHVELKAAQRRGDKPVLVLRTGRWTLQTLADRIAKGDMSGLLEPVDGGLKANVPIAIWQDAELHIAENEKLELSTKGGAFVLNAGTLWLDHASVSGSVETNRVEAFRPFVLTALGGRTLIDGSTVSNLGFGDRPHMRGVSFVSSPFFPTQTKALLRGSRFDGVHSIELAELVGGRLEGNLISNADGSGLRIQGTRDAAVLSNIVVNSANHGMVLSSGTSNTVVSGNVLASNGRSGLFASGGVAGSRIAGNLIVSNLKSGVLLSGNGCVALSGNLVARNSLWGVAAKNSFKLTFEDNTFLRNFGPGLAVETSVFPQDSKRVSGNRFIANRSGILAESYDALELSGNDFTRQRPILFAGELSAHTPRYLNWSQGGQKGTAKVFLANSIRSGELPQQGNAQLTGFSVAELANCQN